MQILRIASISGKNTNLRKRMCGSFKKHETLWQNVFLRVGYGKHLIANKATPPTPSPSPSHPTFKTLANNESWKRKRDCSNACCQGRTSISICCCWLKFPERGRPRGMCEIPKDAKLRSEVFFFQFHFFNSLTNIIFISFFRTTSRRWWTSGWASTTKSGQRWGKNKTHKLLSLNFPQTF